LDKLLSISQLAKRLHGDEAVNHLHSIRNNNCFMHTGICPDDPDDYAEGPHYTRVEYIHAVHPEQTDMLRYDMPGVTLTDINGYAHIVVYTDGSLINPKSEHFVQAGWGMYVGPEHVNNHQSPLHSNAPTVFRAELRAVVHAVMCIACPFVVRTDCKGVYNLCKAIFEGEEYDRRHNDADLLNQIAMIHAQNPLDRVIE